MAAPGTMPPPSTLSNSRMPVGVWLSSRGAMSVMGRAARPSATRAGAVCRVGASFSITVPHCWHSPQRPAHLRVVQPHSVQTKFAVGRAMAPE